MPLTTVNPGLLDTQAQYTGFKNRIINGQMQIDQRNAGASVTNTAGQYLFVTDRFSIYGSQASKFTGQQNAGSVTPPTGFTNYLGITSSSAYSITSSDQFNINHKVEGFNCFDLGWGTANAQTVTLSFWVRSSLTGTFGGALNNSNNTRSYPFSYTISAANTWEQKSITIAGDTSGTWQTTNSTGIWIFFGLGTGSTLSSTAGSWASGSYLSATGATSVVGTNGATFYITGVQLEKGSTATSFDYRPYGTELALCQRYCVQWTGVATGYIMGQINSLTMYAPIQYAMRATPTAAFNAVSINDVSVNATLTSISEITMNGSGGSFRASGSGLTNTRPGMLLNSSSTSFLRFDAEL